MSAGTLELVGHFAPTRAVNDRPASLDEWRVTTGDPDVAKTIHELLGGDEPQEWAAKGEDNLEVFTASTEVPIIIESAKALRQRMVLWGRSGKPIYVSDGERILDDSGHPTEELDPDAELSFAERKAKREAGAIPDTDLRFRLAEEPDLGVFRYRTASWGFAAHLGLDGVAETLKAATRPVRAVLGLEPVSFVARRGAMAGNLVEYAEARISLICAR